MSGGGGGVIIIRRNIRAAADTEAVRESIPTQMLSRLEEVLAKPNADWTDHETHFVWRCVAHAYDCLG